MDLTPEQIRVGGNEIMNVLERQIYHASSGHLRETFTDWPKEPVKITNPREIDLLVALKIMGWNKIVKKDFHWLGKPPESDEWKLIPSYSADLRFAFDVVGKLAYSGGWLFQLCIDPRFASKTVVKFEKIGQSVGLEENSSNRSQLSPEISSSNVGDLALFICIASLKTAGVELLLPSQME